MGSRGALLDVLDRRGAVLTASITNEAVDELKLEGQKAYAVIKASNVMAAVD
jgi:molybdopterin-binding protein